jgi:hypothetical protein
MKIRHKLLVVCAGVLMLALTYDLTMKAPRLLFAQRHKASLAEFLRIPPGSTRKDVLNAIRFRVRPWWESYDKGRFLIRIPLGVYDEDSVEVKSIVEFDPNTGLVARIHVDPMVSKYTVDWKAKY